MNGHPYILTPFISISQTSLFCLSVRRPSHRLQTWGSWAGRYGLQEDAKGKLYYWANLKDVWQGATHRDNSLKRWAVHLQNDFRARLDWCVNDFAGANHPRAPMVRGPLQRQVKSGDKVILDARGSTDPDKQELKFEWLYYAEPGTYRGPSPEIAGAKTALASFIAPKVDSTATLHLLLIATDTGSPPPSRYQRVIVTVKPAANAATASKPIHNSLLRTKTIKLLRGKICARPSTLPSRNSAASSPYQTGRSGIRHCSRPAFLSQYAYLLAFAFGAFPGLRFDPPCPAT